MNLENSPVLLWTTVCQYCRVWCRNG